MESIRIDILNPKAKKLLQELVDLDLISIHEKLDSKSAFKKLISKLRDKSASAPSLEEISEEVKIVRGKRHAK